MLLLSGVFRQRIEWERKKRFEYCLTDNKSPWIGACRPRAFHATVFAAILARPLWEVGEGYHFFRIFVF